MLVEDKCLKLLEEMSNRKTAMQWERRLPCLSVLRMQAADSITASTAPTPANPRGKVQV